jgi:hypothetical protein
MPGMNSGLNVSDPTVVAAFKAALVHQGLIALLIFGLVGLAWITLRASLPASPAAADTATAAADAEPAWRRLLRIGFGLIWVFDGILQAQPKMAVGLPSQVIEPIAARSPHWVQRLVSPAQDGPPPAPASGCTPTASFSPFLQRVLPRVGLPGWGAAAEARQAGRGNHWPGGQRGGGVFHPRPALHDMGRWHRWPHDTGRGSVGLWRHLPPGVAASGPR